MAAIAKPHALLCWVLAARKSAATFANVKQAVAELGFSDQVLNLGDAVEIAAYGVMQTPALVIDRKVVAYGKLLGVEEAKSLIVQAGVQP